MPFTRMIKNWRIFVSISLVIVFFGLIFRDETSFLIQWHGRIDKVIFSAVHSFPNELYSLLFWLILTGHNVILLLLLLLWWDLRHYSKWVLTKNFPLNSNASFKCRWLLCFKMLENKKKTFHDLNKELCELGMNFTKNHPELITQL